MAQEHLTLSKTHFTRRDFLQSTVAAFGYWGLKSLESKANLFNKSPSGVDVNPARTDTLNIFELLFERRERQEQPALGDRIIQTGINEMEIDGNRYKLNVDKKVAANLIIATSKLFGEPDLASKVETWLMENDLEFEIYSFYSSPLSYANKGHFLPPRLTLSQRAYIGIPDTEVKRLFHRTKDGNWKQSENDLDPLIIFPHEGLHLVDFIRSPLVFYARLLAKGAIAATTAATILNNREMKKIKAKGVGDRLLKIGATVLLTTGVNNIVDEIPNLGFHGVIFNKTLKEQMADPYINDFANKWLTFTPTE